MNVNLGNDAELIVLEGDKVNPWDILTKRDYDVFMGKDYFTKLDIDYLDTYYPEYMGVWGTIIAAAGKGIKKVGGGIFRGIKKAVKRKKAKKKKAASAKKQKFENQRREVYEQAIMEQQFVEQEKKRNVNKNMLIVAAVGIGALMLLKNKG